MCFDNDYEWLAGINVVRDWPLGLPTRCEDCYRAIGYGDWRRHVFQQEHEDCKRCEWEDLDDDEEPCDPHDYGETWEGNICRDCCRIREAIDAVEADEGCPSYARQPAFGELDEALQYDDERRYARRALAMYPDLASSRMLRRFAETEAVS